MPSLIIIAGTREGQAVELTDRSLSIGRDPENGIVLGESGVSRHHAIIEPANGMFFIRDQNSENGTFVNEVSIGRALLLDQDEIRIGETRMKFVEQMGEGDLPGGFRPVAVLERTEDSENFFVDTPTEVTPKPEAPSAETLQRTYDRLKTLYALLRPEKPETDRKGQIESALALTRESIEADRLTWIERSPGAEEEFAVAQMVTAQGVSSRNRIAISRTVFTHVEQERRPFFCSNPQTDVRTEKSDSLRQSGIRSVICVPLVEDKDISGFLYADNFVSHESFDKEDLDFLTAVGSLIAEWIQDLRRAPLAAVGRAGSVSMEVGRHTFVTQNARMKQVLETVNKVARSDTTFLVVGESGTGKELVARMAHMASPRARGPFICVNCAALPDTLLESELFGHEKGSFTGAVASRAGKFEAARNGTIFLDEIGDISLSAQAKVLRVLQEKEIEPIGSNKTRRVDVRVVAATNKNLTEEIRAGRFREDLFYRLNVIKLELPPLRERLDDLPALVEFFIQSFKSDVRSPVRRISREALDALSRYMWPGNVRELRNVIERAVVLGGHEEIRPDDLPPEVRGEAPPPTGEPGGMSGAEETGPPGSLADCERRHILRVLNYTGWNKKRSAEMLGISRSALYEKISTYSLEAP